MKVEINSFIHSLEVPSIDEFALYLDHDIFVNAFLKQDERLMAKGSTVDAPISALPNSAQAPISAQF